jgi:hypothetical protein
MHIMKYCTTEHQDFATHFESKFVAPLTTTYKLMPHIKEMLARKKAIGFDAKFEAPSDVWKDSIKLVNSLFGFRAPNLLVPCLSALDLSCASNIFL